MNCGGFLGHVLFFTLLHHSEERFVFQNRSHFVAQAGLKLIVILLFEFSKCWDYRNAPPSLTKMYHLNDKGKEYLRLFFKDSTILILISLKKIQTHHWTLPYLFSNGLMVSYFRVVFVVLKRKKIKTENLLLQKHSSFRRKFKVYPPLNSINVSSQCAGSP